MFDMSHVQYGHIVVASTPLWFLWGFIPKLGPTPPYTNCLDEYSINSIYTHFKCFDVVCLQIYSQCCIIFFIEYKYKQSGTVPQ